MKKILLLCLMFLLAVSSLTGCKKKKKLEIIEQTDAVVETTKRSKLSDKIKNVGDIEEGDDLVRETPSVKDKKKATKSIIEKEEVKEEKETEKGKTKKVTNNTTKDLERLGMDDTNIKYEKKPPERPLPKGKEIPKKKSGVSNKEMTYEELKEKLGITD